MTNPLVGAVWRQLPVSVRRGAVHGALSLLAPRLPGDSTPAEDAPHIVVGFLSSPSGLGQAARLAMSAFTAAGKDVYGVDLTRNFLEVADCVRFPYRDGRRLRGPAHVLININAPYMKYVFHLLGGAFLKNKKITAYWAWELERAPPNWREGLMLAHRIAAPSAFVAGAIRALGPGPEVVVAPHPVALEELPRLIARTEPVSDAAPFVVASSFNIASGFERKNPLALIAAFRTAFAGRTDVQLRLLASGGDHYPEGARRLRAAAAEDKTIALTTDALDRREYWKWYGRPDLFASLHRAEGFGLSLAESMCIGVPVLATNWSANAEYMNAENSLPVNFKLVPVADPQAKYASGEQVWAEPDVAHAASLMRGAAGDIAGLMRLAAQAREDAFKRFSAFGI